MRIFPRKSLCSFGFLVAIIFGFCILLGAEAEKPGKGKSTGEGPVCGTNVMSQMSSSSSSSSVSPLPQNEPQIGVCIEAIQADTSQIIIEEVDNAMSKDIVFEDSPHVIYDKFLRTMDSVKINVEEIINKFEDNLLDDSLKRIYDKFLMAMDSIENYVAEIINTFLFDNANIHDELENLQAEKKNLLDVNQRISIESLEIKHYRDKLKVMYEKLVRSVQTNDDDLQESTVRLKDCQTKLASLGRTNKVELEDCQKKAISWANLATHVKFQLEDCETKVTPLTKQVTSLTEQVTNIQNESLKKEKRITILSNDHKKKVELLQQQYDKSLRIFEDIQLQVDLRQLFNDFRQVSTVGMFIDKIQLLKWAKTCRDDEIRARNELRQNTPNYKETPNQYILADLHWMTRAKTFSALVISLYYDKMKLKKIKDDPSTSLKEQSNTQLKITKRNDQVKALKNVAASYKPSSDADGDASGMTWSEAIGNGYVQWCILVAEANKACHPDMTDEELLNNIRARAEQGTIIHKGRQMREVVMAVIDEIRSSAESSSE